MGKRALNPYAYYIDGISPDAKSFLLKNTIRNPASHLQKLESPTCTPCATRAHAICADLELWRLALVELIDGDRTIALGINGVELEWKQTNLERGMQSNHCIR